MPTPAANPASPDLIVFDFDGTLADSFPWFLSTLDWLADRHRLRRIAPDELEVLRTLGAREIIARLRIPLWRLPLIARDIRRRMATETEGITPFPGVDALLRGLADRGVAAAVVSSNAEANVRRVLGPDSVALIRRFDCGVPLLGKPAALRRTMRALGAAPAATLCVGDEIRDLHAARAVGAAFGAVSWGYTAPDALRALTPDALFANVEEIAAWRPAPPPRDEAETLRGPR